MAEFDFTPEVSDLDIELFEGILAETNEILGTSWSLAEDYLRDQDRFLVTIPDRDITLPWYVLSGADLESIPPRPDPDFRFFPVWPLGEPEEIPPMVVVVSWNAILSGEPGAILGFDI